MNKLAAASIVLAALGLLPAASLVGAQGLPRMDGGRATERLSLACNGCEISGCDSLACVCADAQGGPNWTARADALFLERRDSSSAVLAFNTADPTENLHTDDFRFGSHAGFELALTRRLTSNQAIELRYFGLDHWDAEHTATTTPGDLFQVNASVPIFTFSGDAITASYTSELQNAEINGRQRITDWLHLLAGFRYLELDERGAVSLVNAAVPFDYNITTQNRLYGFQLGGEADLWNDGGRMSLGAIGKAGVFGNNAEQDSSFTTGLVTLPTAGRGSRTSFVGEVGVTGTYQLTDSFSLRGGYRTLWVSGVALASEQLAESDFASGTGFTDSGDVFYHGAFAGLEFSH